MSNEVALVYRLAITRKQAALIIEALYEYADRVEATNPAEAGEIAALKDHLLESFSKQHGIAKKGD